MRNIQNRELVGDLPCDGYIEPKGRTYEEGFRLVLKKGVPETRLFFTIAHELCHTFFYESVPEIKFSPHEVDEQEERLCNYGAACMLMPAEDVSAIVSQLPRSISSLLQIAETYCVSLDMAACRLRSLRIWNFEYSTWRRLTTGEFALDRLYGNEAKEWRWTDEQILHSLWSAEEGAVKAGRTIIEYDVPGAFPAAKPVFYQARRRGELILTLWSSSRFAEPSLPLLTGRGREPAMGPAAKREVGAREEWKRTSAGQTV